MPARPLARAKLRDRLKALFGRIPLVLSPNRSYRRGATVRLAVIHTTESSDSSFDTIVRLFRSIGAQASSHYVVDALAPKGALFTRVVQMVPEPEKAWTQRSANPVATSYELIGRARRTREDWLDPYLVQLETAAALVAEDVLQYGLPVKIADPGIVGHGHLNALGYPNSHTDPGSGFPWDVFLERVSYFVRVGIKVERPKEQIPRAPRPPAVGAWMRANRGRVPAWAWAAMKWHDSGKQGPRPASVEAAMRANRGRIPSAYWVWRKWRLGLR